MSLLKTAKWSALLLVVLLFVDCHRQSTRLPSSAAVYCQFTSTQFPHPVAEGQRFANPASRRTFSLSPFDSTRAGYWVYPFGLSHTAGEFTCASVLVDRQLSRAAWLCGYIAVDVSRVATECTEAAAENISTTAKA